MTVDSYDAKHRAIEVLLEYAELAGCRSSVRDRIAVVADELMVNGLYHAPVDDQGREKYASKTPREMSQLGGLDPIQVQYGCSGRLFGVSVRDAAGSLSRDKILDYVRRAAADAQIESKKSGAGLGLVSVLKSVSKLVFNLHPGHSTEVIALFDIELANEGKLGARSLHVFTQTEQPERRDPGARGRRAGDHAEHMGERKPSSSTLSWVAAVLATGIMCGVGAAVWTKTTLVPGDGLKGQSVIVVPEPADATITLDGREVRAGEPVEIESELPVLTLERDGYEPMTVHVVPPALDGRILRLSLASRQ
jgi:hypothetical protein